MKKIILSVVLVMAIFSSSSNADTLSIASGDAGQCTTQSRQVFGYTLYTISNTVQIAFIGANGGQIQCWVSQLTDARVNMLVSALNSAKTSGIPIFVGLQSNNLYIAFSN